jgi:hypothetical protein
MPAGQSSLDRVAADAHPLRSPSALQLHLSHRRRRDVVRSARVGKHICRPRRRHGLVRSELRGDRRAARLAGRHRGRCTNRRRGRCLDSLRGGARGCVYHGRSVGYRSRGFGLDGVGGTHRGSRDRSRNCWSGNCGNGGLGSRRRERHRARREQAQRIDVPLRIARCACAEVDVRLGQVDHATRPDRAHDRAFSHERPAHHSDRAEVNERGGVAERRLDRHRLAAGRHRPRERHGPLRRSEHTAAGRSAEIDTAMQTGRVGVRVVERKRTQHRAVDGPGPGAGVADREHTRADDQDGKSPHSFPSSLPILRTKRP